MSLVNPQHREFTSELGAQCPKVQISDAQIASATSNGETIASIGQNDFILCQTCAKNAHLYFLKIILSIDIPTQAQRPSKRFRYRRVNSSQIPA